MPSCEKQEPVEGTYTEEIIDGVRHIHNHAPQWGQNPKVALEFVHKIGGMDATDDNYIMFKIWDVVCDQKGNIYILDSGDCRIQKFDAQGRYIATIGRKGEGPSEFGSPVNLNIDDNNRLYVGDTRKYSFIILDGSGAEIRRFKIDNSIIVSVGPRCRLINSETLIMGGFTQGTGGEENYKEYSERGIYSLYHIFNSEGSVTGTFGTMDIKFEEGALCFSGNAFLEIAPGGDMYIAYRYDNKIEKLSPDGTLICVFDRPLNFEETGYKHDWFFGDVYSNSISAGLSVDSENRIWVVTVTEQPEEWVDELTFVDRMNVRKQIAQFELFDSEGMLLGSVPLPEDMFLMRIFGDRLFIVDPDRVAVSEYRIVEK